MWFVTYARLRLALIDEADHTIFKLSLLVEAQVRTKLCLFDELLEQGRNSLIVVRSAEDLADLGESKAFSGGLLEKQGGDLDVTEALGAHFEILFDESDVRINIKLADVVEGALRERLFSLREGKPCQVEGLHGKAIGDRKAMVDRDKLYAFFILLNENVTFVAVQIKEA